MAESRSMTFDEELDLCHEARKLLEAGKKAEATNVIKKIPISPELAHVWVRMVGKEAFLKEGYNLYKVEKAFGKAWVTA